MKNPKNLLLVGEKTGLAMHIVTATTFLGVVFGMAAVGFFLTRSFRLPPKPTHEEQLPETVVLPPKREGRDVWGGWKAIRVDGTGRYRIGEVQGRQTFITPDGTPFYARPILNVSWDNLLEEARQAYFSNDELDWAESSAQEIYRWGFNALGTIDPADEILLEPSVMKVPYFGLFDTLNDWGAEFPNPWDPSWIAQVDARAKEYTAAIADDPFHVAVITVYEPPIDFLTTDATAVHPNSGAFYTTMQAPAGSPAKVELETSLQSRYSTIEAFNATYGTDYIEFGSIRNADLSLFRRFENIDSEEERVLVPQVVEDINVVLAAVIGKYQKEIYIALKKYDPAIVVGGPALSGESAYTKEILQAIAASADFMGVNAFSSEGLDEAYLLKIAEDAGRPVLHTRFTMAQTPCSVDAIGRSFPSVAEQEQRAEAYFDTVNQALDHRQILGNSWNEWIDPDVSRNASAPCSYANFGLFARTGQRYKKLFDRGRELWGEKLFEELLWGRPQTTQAPSPYTRPTPTLPGIPQQAPNPQDFYPHYPLEAPGEEFSPVGELEYPQTEAIIFYPTDGSQQCADTLASFDYLRFGLVASSAQQGNDGLNLGGRSGVGNWSDTRYNFNRMNGGQNEILAAKNLNPDLRVYSHAGLRNVETDTADYGSTHPRRWLFDMLSPRWFAYTPLVKLQAAVDHETTVFEFTSADIENMRRLGAKSAEELGLNPSRWGKEAESQYTYFQGFDNDRGSGSGTTEIMAIGKIVIDGDRGFIHSLTRARAVDDAGEDGEGGKIQSRTIWGKPNTNTYSAGARFGLLSSVDKASYGTNAMGMNVVCADPANEAPFCKEVNAGGSWIEHVVSYVRDIIIPSAAGEVYLNDGMTFDADENRRWQSFNSKFTGNDPFEQQLDLDGDGVADSIDGLSAALLGTYNVAAKRISEEARRQGRDDFFTLMNGALATEAGGESVVYDEWSLDGREWEQFFNVFTDQGLEDAIDQYRRLYNGLIDRDHPLGLLTSRERTSLEQEGKINLKDFRAVAAIGLIFGNGAIGLTGDYTSTFAACGNTSEPDAWMDYFSVDDQGFASTHLNYTGATRRENRHWLGKALGEEEQISGINNTFRRKFERGEAYYSIPGGTLTLEQPMNKVCGTDPVNDCSKKFTSITLEPGDGIILLYP